MKSLSDLLGDLETLFQTQREAAYRTLRCESSEGTTSSELENDFIFGDTFGRKPPEPPVKERVIINTVYANRPAPPSGVTYDPTHANWIGRDVVTSWSIEELPKGN